MTQDEAFSLLRMGHNVFLTGAAGSGKTFLLNKYVAHLRAHGVGVAVTASTGIAATHMNGQTIHSWSGMGVRDALSDDEMKELLEKRRVIHNFKKASVLVIDEISMLHARQLDMVERIARHARDFTLPFGGLQVVLCGDFFQLPPVTAGGEQRFAYEGAAWEKGVFRVCYLQEQWRQKADPLLSVLCDIRAGIAGERAKALLRTRYRKPPEGAAGVSMRPTKLYARNINVDAINERELLKLPGKEKMFQMETRGFPALVDALKKSCLASEKLHLKEGAEVMFVKNDALGRYVNGTRGIVRNFHNNDGWPVVCTLDGGVITAEPEEWRFEEGGTVRAALAQVPLRLAWAITIHKSQGMTLDAAEIDLSDAFEPGMGYVALSRVRSLSGLTLLGLNDTALQVHPKISAHDKRLEELSRDGEAALAQLSKEELRERHEKTLFLRFKGKRDTEAVQKHAADRKRKKKTPTYVITAEFLEQKTPLARIARERGLTEGTILSHMEKLRGIKKLPDISYLQKDIKDFDALLAAFQKSPDGKLTPIFERFAGKHSFDTLKLVRLLIA